MGLRYGSLFTGVGGIDLGFDRAGFENAFQVEIDKTCQRVLSLHWPNVPRFADVKEVTASALAQRGIGPVDVLVGGFPCQDISLAGRRGGLAGQRSGLFYEFMRVAAEIAPRWILIENVPGLLSAACADCGGDEQLAPDCLFHHGGAMGAILGSLGNLGYGFAYRMLDAQYFGLAQRRKRVFIVGHLGTPWSAAAQVLLEREGCLGHSPTRGTTGEDLADGLEGSADGRSRDIAATLNSGGNTGGFRTEPGEHLVVTPTHEVSPCLQERGGKGPDSDMTQAYVTYRKATRTHGGDTPDVWVPDPLTNTLNGAEFSASRTTMAVVETTNVRRLTPLECERLQGFPDNWTATAADSSRYKMMGNAVAVPVAQWIASRLRDVQEGLK